MLASNKPVAAAGLLASNQQAGWLVSCLQTTTKLVGCWPATNQLVGCLPNQLVGWLVFLLWFPSSSLVWSGSVWLSIVYATRVPPRPDQRPEARGMRLEARSQGMYWSPKTHVGVVRNMSWGQRGPIRRAPSRELSSRNFILAGQLTGWLKISFEIGQGKEFQIESF